MATHIFTDKVIDLNAAREARKARPFQGRLLRKEAARMGPDSLATMRVAVADGFAGGKSIEEIARNILRDEVRQKARAAL